MGWSPVAAPEVESAGALLRCNQKRSPPSVTQSCGYVCSSSLMLVSNSFVNMRFAKEGRQARPSRAVLPQSTADDGE